MLPKLCALDKSNQSGDLNRTATSGAESVERIHGQLMQKMFMSDIGWKKIIAGMLLFKNVQSSWQFEDSSLKSSPNLPHLVTHLNVVSLRRI